MAKNNLVKIGGELKSVAEDGVVAGAEAIYDYTEGKSQATINQDLKDAIEDIDVTEQISGKADKSEMSVVAGTGANADKTTITLKNGTSATVLTQHQDVSGKEDKSNKVTSFSSPTDTQYPSAKLVSDQFATKQNTISDLSTIRSGASAGATAYQKPVAGIPPTDLDSAVQTSLGKADTAIQSVTVGTTTTGAAGTNASVTNTGTATAPVLNFIIPQGPQGIQGEQGERGPKGDTGITGDVSTLTIVHGIEPKAFYEETQVAGADAVQELYLDKYTYLELKNVTGWHNGNVVNLVAGKTYIVTIENPGDTLTYFKVVDENDNATDAPFTSNWRYSKVNGYFTTEYTPEVNIVKINYYSNKESSCSVVSINSNKVILTKNDFVDGLMKGGVDKPVSAEQGKELYKNISILNQYTIPLSLGEYGRDKHASDSFTKARACIANNGFKYLRVKTGYEYVLYAANTAAYVNPTDATTIVGTYTSEIYVNNSDFAYFFITVQRTDGGVLQMDELFDIITLELDTSIYNFKHLNDVSEYYKYAKEFDIEGYDYIEGEGIGINQGVNVNSAYRRTTNIDVSELDALKIYYDSDWDATSNKKVICGWFDESSNYLWTTKFLLRTQDRIVILEVPKNVKYASVDCSDKKFKIAGLKHEETAADAHYYNSGKSEIAKLKDVTLILCCGQSLMGGADAPGISYEETYFPLRQLGYVSNEIRHFARLVNGKENIGAEKPDRGIGEMFIEAIAKENGISVYANEWERHLIVLVNTSRGGLTIAQLTDDTEYVKVTNAITNTKTLCDKFGLTMAAPAWVWFQGEQDIKAAMSSADYKTALLAYQDKICNSLSTIAGITKRPKCCIYQPGSQCLYSQTYNFVNPYLEFNNAYVELLRDNDEFIACAPVYIFDGADNNGGFVHLNARSYKTLGAYAGYSIKKALIDGVKVKGVIPIDVTVDGTTINIKYNVPCPPLKFDTEWVKEPPLTNGVHNYGFNVVKSDDTELITNVSVFDDTVTIECSESPIGAKLRYGLNGDRIHMTNSEYWGIDGRIHGGRGNLRDSQGDYVQKEIRELGQTMRLDNWAYCFEELLTEPTGE